MTERQCFTDIQPLKINFDQLFINFLKVNIVCKIRIAHLFIVL